MEMCLLTEDTSQCGGRMVFKMNVTMLLTIIIVLSFQILGMIFAMVLICKIGSEGTFA